MGVFGDKIGWRDTDPLTNSFFLLGVLTSVPILVKIAYGLSIGTKVGDLE